MVALQTAGDVDELFLSTDVRAAEKKSVKILVIVLSGEVQMPVVQFLHPGATVIMFEVFLSRGVAPQYATIAGAFAKNSVKIPEA